MISRAIITAAAVASLGLGTAACGASSAEHHAANTTHATTTATRAHYSASAREACQQLDQAAAAMPKNNFAPLTFHDFLPYIHAVDKLVQTAYGPGSEIVMKAMKDANVLPVVGNISDQQLALVDRDAASLGTFCGRMLSS